MYQAGRRAVPLVVIRIEETRRYPVTREAAFDYITDPHNWHEYWPDLVGVDDVDAPWRDPGDRMRLRMRLNGRPVELHLTLRERVRPSLVRYASVQSGLPDIAHERHFTAGGAPGFLYRLNVEYEPRRGLAGLLDRTLVRYGMRRAMRRTLDNLSGRLTP
jgi:uncharacterized protein YndB with AHSA1/START domain